MPVNITSKTHTFTNGTANDAAPVDAEFTNLHNNCLNLKTETDALLLGNVKEGLALTLRSAFSGTPASTDHVQIIAERGVLTNSSIRWNEEFDRWELTTDGTNYFPVALVTSSDPGSPQNGWVWYNTTANKLKAYLLPHRKSNRSQAA